MGRRVVDLVHADPELQLVGAVTHTTHAALGRDAGEVAGIGPLGIVLEPDCTGPCHRHKSSSIFRWLTRRWPIYVWQPHIPKPIVIGTTGLRHRSMKKYTT